MTIKSEKTALVIVLMTAASCLLTACHQKNQNDYSSKKASQEQTQSLEAHQQQAPDEQSSQTQTQNSSESTLTSNTSNTSEKNIGGADHENTLSSSSEHENKGTTTTQSETKNATEHARTCKPIPGTTELACTTEDSEGNVIHETCQQLHQNGTTKLVCKKDHNDLPTDTE